MAEGITWPIVMGIFLVLAAASFFLLASIWGTQSATVKEASLRQADQHRTAIEIRSAGATSPNCLLFTGPYLGEVKNVGRTAFGNFRQLDLLVQYTDLASAKVVTRLAYGTGWTVVTITPDNRDPNIWNPEETITINFTLPSLMLPSTQGTIIMATPLGVADSKYFACTVV